jgi:hypothetical protein
MWANIRVHLNIRRVKTIIHTDYRVGWYTYLFRLPHSATILYTICKGRCSTARLLSRERDAQEQDASDHLIEWEEDKGELVPCLQGQPIGRGIGALALGPISKEHWPNICLQTHINNLTLDAQRFRIVLENVDESSCNLSCLQFNSNILNNFSM